MEIFIEAILNIVKNSLVDSVSEGHLKFSLKTIFKSVIIIMHKFISSLSACLDFISIDRFWKGQRDSFIKCLLFFWLYICHLIEFIEDPIKDDFHTMLA